MSQHLPAASSDDTLLAENRSSVDDEKPRLASISPHSGEQLSDTSRAPLHPSAPVEPPLEPTQVRSLGVQSILNPPAAASADLAGNPGPGDGLGLQSAGPSSRSRQASSLSDHPAHQGRRLSLSPGIGQRHILTPASPTARFVRQTSRKASYSGQASTSTSHSPLIHESKGMLYHAPPGPAHLDPVSGPPSSMMGTHPPTSVSHHSMPPLPSPRMTAVPATHPSSHEASPRMSHSYGQFGRSSPAVVNMRAPFPPGYSTPELHPRLPAITGGSQRPAGDESQQSSSFVQGKIPLYLDLKSGSSTQAAKRKANSDASRRFRHRKRNDEEVAQRFNAQQDEIRNQTEAMNRQAEEIRALTHERDFYRSERDFYRDQLARSTSLNQLPPRPPSPRSLRLSTSEQGSGGNDPWHGMEAPRPAVVGSIGPAGQLAQPSPAPYPAALPAYAERGNAPDERPLPQVPRTWTSA